jgi:hypothetical protein
VASCPIIYNSKSKSHKLNLEKAKILKANELEYSKKWHVDILQKKHAK